MAEPPGPPSAPWAALPADMLQSVFTALPDAASRAACRAVCRQWRQVADQGPEVWQYVHCRRPSTAPYLRRSLTAAGTRVQWNVPQRLPTVMQLSLLLRRQREHLRRLVLEDNASDWDDAPAALEALLRAATADGSGLTDLTIALSELLPGQVTAVLPGGAAHLTSLVLRPVRGRVPVPPQLRLASFSSSLRQLNSLSITNFVPAESLSQLTALTRLRLAFQQQFVPDASVALLACTTRLARLELSGFSVRALQLHLLQEGAGLALPAAGAAIIMNLVQQLAGPVVFEPVGAGAPVQQAGAAQPGGAAAAGEPLPPPLPPPSGPPPLLLPPPGSIGAALLPRWQQLEHLRLHNCELDASVLTVLPHLQNLTALHLSARCPVGPMMAAVQRCSRLQELVLGRIVADVAGAAFELPPPAPGVLTQLTRLRFSGCDRMGKFDASWCSLPNLLSFEVESCDLLELPSLAGLTRVEQLVFSHQRLEQLPSSVSKLTALTRLAVAACSLGELRPGPYLRGLRELNLFANSLSAVPPALAHPRWRPTALQLLDMSNNYSHHLSDADVAVLGKLRTLTTLRLWRQEFAAGDAHPTGPLVALRVALPNCQIDA